MHGNVDLPALGNFAFASRKLPEYMHFQQMICTRCDLVFSSPAPNTSWLHDNYRTAAFDAGLESAYAASTYEQEIRRWLPLLPSSLDSAKALDIGAGDGAFLVALKRLGFKQVLGIEPSAEPVRRAVPEVAACLLNEFFDPARFPAESQALVTCFQTLEHVPDPLSLCRSVRDLLLPGGMFVCVAHDFRAPLARLLGARSPIYDIEHLQLFSAASLGRLLEHSGYRGVDVHSLRNAYPLHYWLRLAPLPARLKSSLEAWARRSRTGRMVLSARVGNIVGTGIR
jgi:SAM-dependent methyltransferase